MRAKAKFHVNYNGVWYSKGDVLDVSDSDKFDMAEYFDFDDNYVPITNNEELVENETVVNPKRGRPKKN